MYKKKWLLFIILFCALLVLILANKKYPTKEFSITYPLNGTVFPPEIIAPTFTWQTGDPPPDKWSVHVNLPGTLQRINVKTDTTTWTPDRKTWESIKKNSLDKSITITIKGQKKGPFFSRILYKKSVTISTSPDSVAAPIFYRDVPLPFSFARRNLRKIKWRLLDISSNEMAPVVMENLPTCANCHSFSADGKTLGMDMDIGKDKGGYLLAPFEKETYISPENIFTWSDLDPEKKMPTFGMLSAVSPDGRFIISGLRDRSVFLDRFDPYFTQLFFPVIGVLAYYNTNTKTIHELPGANDPYYVQSNGGWSPDGRTIVFARNKAVQLKTKERKKGPTLSFKESAEVLGGEQYLIEGVQGGNKFLFNLYQIPFNNGKGGKAVPLPGASHNGKSNFFAKYSPDSKWIVFTQAPSYMLNQENSKLVIIPAEGGEPRLMNCNIGRMNSWHSWSPNGKWLVFSSKTSSPYTQLYLTHIDENGIDSPPVFLKNSTANERAANIPEFVNIKPEANRKIKLKPFAK